MKNTNADDKIIERDKGSKKMVTISTEEYRKMQNTLSRYSSIIKAISPIVSVRYQIVSDVDNDKDFILNSEDFRYFESLSLEQRGILLTAIFNFQNGKTLPEMDQATEIVFNIIRDKHLHLTRTQFIKRFNAADDETQKKVAKLLGQ